MKLLCLFLSTSSSSSKGQAFIRVCFIYSCTSAKRRLSLVQENAMLSRLFKGVGGGGEGLASSPFIRKQWRQRTMHCCPPYPCLNSPESNLLCLYYESTCLSLKFHLLSYQLNTERELQMHWNAFKCTWDYVGENVELKRACKTERVQCHFYLYTMWTSK